MNSAWAAANLSRVWPEQESPPPDPERAAVALLVAGWPPERIQLVLDEVLEQWGVLDLRAVIRWRWNAGLRTTVGRALLDDMCLELNPRLLARHPHEVRPVLVHEAAHLVVQRLFGRQPMHGRIWRAYMRRAGESTRATHELDTSGLERSRTRRHRARL